MTKIMHALLLSCEEASFLITIKQEGKLSAWKRFRLRLHIYICHNCTEFEKQNKAISEMVNKIKCEDFNNPNNSLCPKKKAEIKQQISEEINKKR